MFLKKILACAASIAMIAGAVPGITRNPMSDLPASVITADAVTYGNLTYQVSGDHVIITACNTDASTVTVPPSFNGLPVTVIGEGAFQGCYSLNEITLPDTITSINANAFYSCDRLYSIELPSSLTSIGSNAFYGCMAFTEIEIPSSVTSIG